MIEIQGNNMTNPLEIIDNISGKVNTTQKVCISPFRAINPRAVNLQEHAKPIVIPVSNPVKSVCFFISKQKDHIFRAEKKCNNPSDRMYLDSTTVDESVPTNKEHVNAEACVTSKALKPQ